jgi:hypothetical protein
MAAPGYVGLYKRSPSLKGVIHGTNVRFSPSIPGFPDRQRGSFMLCTMPESGSKWASDRAF